MPGRKRGGRGKRRRGELRGEPRRRRTRRRWVRPGPWLDAEHRSFVEEVGDDEHLLVLRGELVTPPLRLDPARGDAGHRPRARAGVEDPGGGAPRGDRRGPFGGRGRHALRGVRLRDGGGHLPGRLLLLPRAGGHRERGEGRGTRRPVLREITGSSTGRSRTHRGSTGWSEGGNYNRGRPSGFAGDAGGGRSCSPPSPGPA